MDIFKGYPGKLPSKTPKEVFDKLDVDKKGEIDFEKFKKYPSKGVINERVKSVDEMFDELDKDKNNMITKEELSKLPYKGTFRKGKTTDQIFDILDKEKESKSDPKSVKILSLVKGKGSPIEATFLYFILKLFVFV